jgi:4-amino-4-deoxy-L-arabinose transferase-like glycosyltransferase
MIHFAPEIKIALLTLSLPTLASLYFFFVRQNQKLGLLFLILTGFLLRLLMASIDPYLQDWDERYHALVASNMMENPFKPMLRVDPIMFYKMEDWCCNHIWVHKQPLFMWQMAVSMAIFGKSELALRLPSVLMGTVSIYLIFQIAQFWTKNDPIAYVSAFLCTFSYYQLELTSGLFSLDHNDLTFAFYVTAATWALTRYLQSVKNTQWAIVIGIFVGCAVLTKWLTAYLVFGGWALLLLLESERRKSLQSWTDLGTGLVISIIVFVPWQLYIMQSFPAESAIMYGHNRRHIFEALDGHAGGMDFHLAHMSTMYGNVGLLFLIVGLVRTLWVKAFNKSVTYAFLAMIAVIYAFFSILVQTKMGAFTYPVHAIIWILVAIGVMFVVDKIQSAMLVSARPYLACLILLGFSVLQLKPWRILDHRRNDHAERNSQIHNTNIYKNLGTILKDEKRVVLNCKSLEDVEVMFWVKNNAYQWWPEPNVLDSLAQKGYQFAAFRSHNNQALPDHVAKHPGMQLLDVELK